MNLGFLGDPNNVVQRRGQCCVLVVVIMFLFQPVVEAAVGTRRTVSDVVSNGFVEEDGVLRDNTHSCV